MYGQKIHLPIPAFLRNSKIGLMISTIYITRFLSSCPETRPSFGLARWEAGSSEGLPCGTFNPNRDGPVRTPAPPCNRAERRARRRARASTTARGQRQQWLRSEVPVRTWVGQSYYLPTRCDESFSFSQIASINSMSGRKSRPASATVHVLFLHRNGERLYP